MYKYVYMNIWLVLIRYLSHVELPGVFQEGAGPDPNGAPWAIMGQALVGPSPCALVGRALVRPLGLMGHALAGPWALMGRALMPPPGPLMHHSAKNTGKSPLRISV